MRLLVLAAALTAAFAVAAPGGFAADECNGFLSCIPVAGPWVAIPAAGISSAEWQLKCPEGIVGGVDARVSDRAVAISFGGLVGSPVNPGITTRDSVVFTGTYGGKQRRATTFRPFIGCIPATGGGRRTPTAWTPLKPGLPITVRVKALRVRAGSLARARHGCRAGERLLRAGHAVGLYTRNVPTPAQLTAVRVVSAVEAGQILVSATRSGLPARLRVVVQIQAECAA